MLRKGKVQNVGTPGRWVRALVGNLLALIGLAYLLGVPLSMVVLGPALALLGEDFVYTGITGYCPHYNNLGFSTALPSER
ncbi:MAG TPA: DUF2892 domain-containing protein [Rubrobacter sp.]|nr:DUF2892 domain-containing protein [Rubrobacter sp.]